MFLSIPVSKVSMQLCTMLYNTSSLTFQTVQRSYNTFTFSFAVNPWHLHNNFHYASGRMIKIQEEAKAICEIYGGTLAMLKTPGARNALQMLGLRNTGNIKYIISSTKILK